MLLNKVLTVLCTVMLLIFGGMSFAGMMPNHEQAPPKEKTEEDRKTSNDLEDDREDEKDVVEDKTPDDELEDKQSEGNALFRNDAPEFYYYTVLSDDGKKIYDAMVELAVHPEIPDYEVTKDLTIPVTDEKYNSLVRKVRQAIEFDHPELFWYFEQTLIPWTASGYAQPNESGNYRVTYRIVNPFDNYVEMMTEFNDAADAFLADIDRTQRPEQIVLAIHDKLIGMVKYDYETLNGAEGYAHTAYGALVQNGRGGANSAVCDGYTKAYTYLLQQCGIVSVEIVGWAGSPGNQGLHAWNCIRLDTDWYEIDSTWDDSDPLESFPDHPDHAKAMLADQEYMDLVTHAYFLLTTDQMNNFTDIGTKYDFSVDGWTYHMHGESVRTRVTDPEMWPISEEFPVARGNSYSYSLIKAG